MPLQQTIVDDFSSRILVNSIMQLVLHGGKEYFGHFTARVIVWIMKNLLSE